jgi:hypothetical protein
MVRETMYKEVQIYKQKGHSMRMCSRDLKLDRKTVRKYWAMSVEEYLAYLSDCKRRTKILDAYQGEITQELSAYPSITSAIIHDHLLCSDPCQVVKLGNLGTPF